MEKLSLNLLNLILGVKRLLVCTHFIEANDEPDKIKFHDARRS